MYGMLHTFFSHFCHMAGIGLLLPNNPLQPDRARLIKCDALGVSKTAALKIFVERLIAMNVSFWHTFQFST